MWMAHGYIGGIASAHTSSIGGEGGDEGRWMGETMMVVVVEAAVKKGVAPDQLWTACIRVGQKELGRFVRSGRFTFGLRSLI